jgi:hypothetical protein
MSNLTELRSQNPWARDFASILSLIVQLLTFAVLVGILMRMPSILGAEAIDYKARYEHAQFINSRRP